MMSAAVVAALAGAQALAAPFIPGNIVVLQAGDGTAPLARAEIGGPTSDPATVARRIARAVSDLGVGRFDLIYTAGSQPVSARLRAVELYGTKVVPMVRDLLAG